MTAVETITARGASLILVVDDHAVNCELLDAMLAPQGYQVEQAYSGPEALAIADTRRPDLILLDVSMPGMDGFEVATRLRDRDETRLIPIVMVTALGDLEHRVRGLESGADDYLVKPVNRAELLARVQSTLRLSYFRRQVDERQKLDLILADVSDGILITNADGAVREASPSARRLLGLGDAAAGRALGDLWGPLHGAPEDLPGAIARGQALDFVLQRDEPPLFLAASLRPVIDPDGAATAAVLSVRDVTRETLEHKLQQDVLSLVSHKFRTPLTVVTLWTKMLREEDCGPLNDQQREALTAMGQASDQLRGLLEGMLSYLEWTKRLRGAHRRRLSFKELESTLSQRAQEVVVAPHRFVIERDPEGQVVVDDDLFLEALVELLRNAVKFAGDKPVTVRVELRRDGARALVSVSDNGPGIPPEQLGRIFDRFYQVETDFTGQVHGVGLGLALVKTAVEALGGTIHVKSQLQQGTRFEIVL
jgi:signal transduction histidine kinase